MNMATTLTIDINYTLGSDDIDLLNTVELELTRVLRAVNSFKKDAQQDAEPQERQIIKVPESYKWSQAMSKIEVIMELRTACGKDASGFGTLSLKDAKDIVDGFPMALKLATVSKVKETLDRYGVPYELQRL